VNLTLARLQARVSNEDGSRVRLKTIRIDGGREFALKDLTKKCDEEGIEVVLSTAHNQYQNGVAERGIRFLQDEARAVVIQMRIPTCFWDRVLTAAAYVINRTGQSTVKDLTPHESYWNDMEPAKDTGTRPHQPDNSKLLILGSRCVAHIDRNEKTRGEKLYPNGAKALFLGYQGNSNYVVWLIEGSRILITPHVTFHEYLGDAEGAPDPADVVRSLPQQTQRRLRHRPKPTKGWVKDSDHNVVPEDITDSEDGLVKRKRGRPKKKKTEVYQAWVLEAPEDDESIHQALQQEGEYVHDDHTMGPPILSDDDYKILDSRSHHHEENFSLHQIDNQKITEHHYQEEAADAPLAGGQKNEGSPDSLAFPGGMAFSYDLSHEMNFSHKRKRMPNLDHEEDKLFTYAASYGEDELYELFEMESPRDPTFKEAMAGPEKDQWWKAICQEIMENVQRDTFQFIHRNEAVHKHLIDAKWVLKKKYNSDGSLEKYKARVVARGFTQRLGVDYSETVATTARAASWRMLMALAAIKGWHILQVDFVSAFLNGDLREKIYMKQFLGLPRFFEEFTKLAKEKGYSEEKIIQVLNPLYGLKQAAAEWQRKAKSLMKKHGFIPMVSDDAVFYDPQTEDVVATYVDDFLLFGPNRQRLEELVAKLKKEIQLKDLGDAEWFLGVRIRRSAPTGDVRIDVEQYLDTALDSCDFTEHGRKVANPMDPGMLSETYPNEGKSTEKETHDYASLVGKFNFSSCMLRIDTAFATSTWARFMSNPSQAHQQGLKRVPRYLRSNIKRAIRYRRLNDNGTTHPHSQYNELGLFGAVDSSYASDPEGSKSVTGYVFFMGGGPILWRSHRQSFVTKASTAAEYVAISEAADEATWIRNFLTELKMMPEGPLTILEDNTGAKKWAESSNMNKEKKHLKLHVHAVRDEVAEGRIRIEWAPSNLNPADGLTKPLDSVKHQRFVELLGLEEYQ
jgi:hypothetical protein